MCPVHPLPHLVRLMYTDGDGWKGPGYVREVWQHAVGCRESFGDWEDSILQIPDPAETNPSGICQSACLGSPLLQQVTAPG